MTEHAAVRQGAGMIALAGYGLVRLAGKDAANLLDGILSNDIKKLQVGHGVYATLLSDVGRLRSVLHVYRTEDALLLETLPGQAGAVMEAIDYYIFTEDVQMSDVSAQHLLVTVQGPKAEAVVSSRFGDISGLGELDHVTLKNTFIVRHSRTGEDGFDLWLTPDNLPLAWDWLHEAGAVAISAETLEVLRVEAAMPRYGVDMSEAYNPLETGILRAISFDKGCYLGQETIARITFLSKPVKRLVAVLTDPPALVDGPIMLGEKQVGVITSAVESPTLGRPIAMGYVKNDTIKSGARLRVGDNEAVTAELPLYRSPSLSYEPADQVAPPVAEGQKPRLPF